MKTNKSYKLVLHKKGFGGSGKQGAPPRLNLIIFIGTMRCDCNWAPPLSRRRAGCQLKGFPPGQFGGHHWDRTPDRWIQVRVCKVQNMRCVFLKRFTDSLVDVIYPSPLLLQVKSLKEDLQKGKKKYIYIYNNNNNKYSMFWCLLPVRDHAVWIQQIIDDVCVCAAKQISLEPGIFLKKWQRLMWICMFKGQGIKAKSWPQIYNANGLSALCRAFRCCPCLHCLAFFLSLWMTHSYDF